MLSLQGVGKEYNLRPVLEDVSLMLERGASYSLSAPNGSGKSTLLHIMAGLTRPTTGLVSWAGKRLYPKMRGKIGILLQQPMLFGDLTAVENLVFYARMYSVENPRKTAEEWVEAVGLKESATVRVREFSKGMKQRLALARCLIHQPEVLLLDEPYDGLDVASRKAFEGLFRAQVERGTTLFLVTHREEEAMIAARCFTLNYGRVVEV